MAMQTESLSDAVKTLYGKDLLSRALPALVHGRHGMTPRWRNYGSYEVRRYESLDVVTSTLTEGNTPNESAAPTITTITMTPSWYGAYVKYTDKLVMTAYDPVVGETVQLQGEQAGLSIDTISRNALTAGATKDYAGGASSRATIDKTNDLISFADIVQNVGELMAQNARPVEAGMYVIAAHPHSITTLMLDEDFKTLFTREGGESIRSGMIGTIMNCKIYVTSNARKYVNAGQNSTEDVYSMLFIGAEAYACAGLTGLAPRLGAPDGVQYGGRTGQGSPNIVDVIVRDLGETGFDPLKMVGTIGWKATHVDQVLNSNWLRDLEHANDFS